MEDIKVYNVAIVGAGPGGKAIMDMIFAEKLGGLKMKLVGVADMNPQALGYQYAQQKGIYATADYHDLYKLKDLNIIIDLTGNDKVADEIYRTKPGHVRLIDNVAARLFWDIFQIEEKRISERKHAEEALAAEKERLAVTLRSIGDGVAATDTEGKLVLMNKVAEQLSGWVQQDVIGKPFDEVFHIINEKKRELRDRPVEKVLKTGRIVSLTGSSVLVARDSTEKVIAYTASPIRDKDSRIIGAVLVFKDITEKRKLEQEVIKSQKLESIGILAGGIAHDFNNILTSILGNIGLAKKYVDPEDKVHKRLTEAEKASFQAKDLTQRLLTFSKGGAPVIKTASIAELLKDWCTFALSGSNVRWELSVPDDLWLVEIDEGQMGQVINNLIINAVQAMPKGGVVRVACENVAATEEDVVPLQSGKYVKISVKDQGIGIPKEYLQRIFDPYFTTKQKGSGLGLTTCYSIIKNHNGYIGVESEPGVGTTFYIYLPASGKEIPAKKSWEKKPVLGEGKILLMDDDEMVRDVAGEMLNHVGYEVEFARDGEEAIELYRGAKESGRPFDAVIMDLTVSGGMGGRESIKKLIEIDPQVKAIVSSGYCNDPVMAEFKKYGFSGVVAKPYKIEELSKALRRALCGG